MNKELQIFKNEELNLKVRAIQNKDGSISINAEDTALGFGWYESKNNKIYPRWRVINGYIKDLGVSQKVAKDDYIPESLFYMLGMKASNEAAQEFQKWLAIQVLPQIRKEGKYQVKKIEKSDEGKKLLAEAKIKNAKARIANTYLKMAESDAMPKEFKQIMFSYASKELAGKEILPLPKTERKTYTATEIGNILGLSSNKVGKLANQHNLKTSEYGIEVWDKAKHSNKQIPTFRYYENAIEVIRNLL